MDNDCLCVVYASSNIASASSCLRICARLICIFPKQLKVREGDALVTAGTHNARYPDLYPYGILIGRVSSVGATDTSTFLQVQVQPFANLGSLDAVAVLVPKKTRR